MILLIILAVFGLAFAIKEADGPWDLVSKWRNLMMRIPVIGPQFYKLLDCYYCLGFHCGWIVYLLSAETCKWQFFIMYALAGGAGSLILSAILDRLHRE
jgi:hypothetical protein